MFTPMAATSLAPEAVEVDVKLVLIGFIRILLIEMVLQISNKLICVLERAIVLGYFVLSATLVNERRNFVLLMERLKVGKVALRKVFH